MFRWCMKLLTLPNDRYFPVPDIPLDSFPPQLHDYNARFTRTLENIKRRHDPTVTTVAQGVLEWKNSIGTAGSRPGSNSRNQAQATEWLDRFYMSRIGIRFLIGQREFVDCLNIFVVSLAMNFFQMSLSTLCRRTPTMLVLYALNPTYMTLSASPSRTLALCAKSIMLCLKDHPFN